MPSNITMPLKQCSDNLEFSRSLTNTISRRHAAQMKHFRRFDSAPKQFELTTDSGFFQRHKHGFKSL